MLVEITIQSYNFFLYEPARLRVTLPKRKHEQSSRAAATILIAKCRQFNNVAR